MRLEEDNGEEISLLVGKICHGERDERLSSASQFQTLIGTQPENSAKLLGRHGFQVLYELDEQLCARLPSEVKEKVAGCIGVIGFVLHARLKEFLDWIFDKYRKHGDDEIKGYYLKSLVVLFQYDAKSEQLFLERGAAKTLSELRKVLETADSFLVLEPLLSLCQLVARNYPTLFQPHFRDISDILIGWCIDIDQRESVVKSCEATLLTFKQFWVADSEFCIHLLGQFLEDACAYAEDLSCSINQKPTSVDPNLIPRECLARISALLRVYRTLLAALQDFFNASSSVAPVSASSAFIGQSLDRLQSCLGTVLLAGHVNVVQTVNGIFICASLLLQCARPYIDTLMPQFLTVASSLKDRDVLLRSCLSNFLTYLKNIIDASSSDLISSFVVDLIGPYGYLFVLREHKLRQTKNNVLDIYCELARPRGVSTLQQVFRFLLSEAEIILNHLYYWCHPSSERRCGFNAGLSAGAKVVQLVNEKNVFTESRFLLPSKNVKKLHNRLLFIVSVMMEIGNAKNSVIAMWALNPSLFAILLDHFPLKAVWLRNNFPVIQYALLNCLRSHCETHDNFLSSSDLLVNPVVNKVMNSPTSVNFESILDFLARMLADRNTISDIRISCVEWTTVIIKHVKQSNSAVAVFSCPQFVELACSLNKSLFQSDMNKNLVLDCLKQVFDCSLVHLPLKFWESLSTTLINSAIGHEFLNCFQYMPFASFIRLHEQNPAPNCNNGLEMHCISKFRSVRRKAVSTYGGGFLPAQVTPILDFLLKNEHSEMSCDDNMDFGRKEILAIHLAVRQPRLKQTEETDNFGWLWRWMTWTLSEYFIASRLKTSLGKPQDTFMAIEAAIKKLANEIMIVEDTKKIEKGQLSTASTTQATESSKVNQSPISVSNHSREWARVRLLLIFLEDLEKNMFGAYEGCAHALSLPTKASRAFFVANRNTCQEWLSRIHVASMTIALHNGQPAMVLRLAWQAIRDAEASVSDSVKKTNTAAKTNDEFKLILIITALIELGASDALRGVICWAKKYFPSINQTLLEPAQFAAESRFEVSTAAWKTFISSEINLLNTDDDAHTGESKISALTLGFAFDQALNGYRSLCDWKGVDEWIKIVDKCSSENGVVGKAVGVFTQHRREVLRKLASFGSNELGAVSGHDQHQVNGHDLVSPFCDSGNTGKMWTGGSLLDWIDERVFSDMENDKEDGSKNLCKQRLLGNIQAMMYENLYTRISLSWPPGVNTALATRIGKVDLIRKIIAKERVDVSFLAPFNSAGPSEIFPSLAVIDTLRAGADLYAENHFDSDVEQIIMDAARGVRKTKNFATSIRLIRTALRLRKPYQTLGVLSEPSDAKYLLQNIPLLFSGSDSKSSANINALKLSRLSAKTLRCAGQPVEAFKLLSDALVQMLEVVGPPMQAGRTVLTSHTGDGSLQTSPMRSNTIGKNIIIDDAKLNDSENVGFSISTEKTERAIQDLSITNSKSVEHQNGYNVRSLVSAWKWPGLLSRREPGMGDIPNLVTVETTKDANYWISKCVGLLAEWMQKDGAADDYGALLLQNEDSTLVKLIEHQLHLAEGTLDSDSVVGALKSLSVFYCSSIAKNQSLLADWAYTTLHKHVDPKCEDKLVYSTKDIEEINELLPDSVSMNAILQIISKVQVKVPQHQLLQTIMSSFPDIVNASQLTQIWLAANQKIHRLCELSVKSYFNYLHFTSPLETEGTSPHNGTELRGVTEVQAVLRLLKFLLRYSQALQPLLQEGFSRSNPIHWKCIIPQLLARLSHKDPWVRGRVSHMLSKIAVQFPVSIAYSGVVGALAGSSRLAILRDDDLLFDDPKRMDEDSLREDRTKEEQDFTMDGMNEEIATKIDAEECLTKEVSEIEDAVMHDSYSEILDCLDPSLVSHLKDFVKELHKITLLRDELWLTCLSHLQQEISRRLKSLNKEIEKVRKNMDISGSERKLIIREKKDILVRMLSKMTEDLSAVSCGPPETMHDSLFLNSYLPLIQRARERLKARDIQPREAWEPFQQILTSLLQRANRKSSLSLNLSSISTKLSKIVQGKIPMPGVVEDGCGRNAVYIASIDSHVTILPTKTKPKRFTMVGSDGKRYSYLFKGLEDLHLDERVMQFLRMCNAIFRSCLPGHRKDHLHARNYTVTPLGPRAGLIQWVDGATPIFHFYKRWQIRQALGLQYHSANQHAPNVSVPRPSEQFYVKLTAALKKFGISDTEVRKDWPSSVVLEVLKELLAETPRDLLQKELWCTSVSAEEWWLNTENLARSSAVMSVIGYVIGLGDRHLDNLLVDLLHGEIIHVDYNVCFEKGSRLQVPEKVPFRMTQNLEAALGLTGVEGTYRESCKAAMEPLRSHADVLLTLLEAFVYDPLVDWKPLQESVGVVGHHLMLAIYGNTERFSEYRSLAKEMAIRLFRVRIMENKHQWIENKKALGVCLDSLTAGLEAVKADHESAAASSARLAECRSETALVTAALNNPDHDLFSLPRRFGKYSVVRRQYQEAVDQLEVKRNNCQEWVNAYKKAFEKLQDLSRLRFQIETLSYTDAGIVLVEEFLVSSGQAVLVAQLKEIDKDLLSQQELFKRLLSDVCLLLSQYMGVQQSMPLSRFLNHRIYLWRAWLESASQTDNVAELESIVDEINEAEEAQQFMDSNLVELIVKDMASDLEQALTVCSAIIADQERCSEAVAHADEYLVMLSNQTNNEINNDSDHTESFVIPAGDAWKAFSVVLPLVKSCIVTLYQLESTGGSLAPDGVTLNMYDTPSSTAQFFKANSIINECVSFVGKLSPNCFTNVQTIKPTASKLALLSSTFEELIQVLTKELVPVLIQQAVTQQPSFTYLSTTLMHLVTNIGMTPTEMFESLTAVADEREPFNEDLMTAIREAQTQFSVLLDQLRQSANYSSNMLVAAIDSVSAVFLRVGFVWRETIALMASLKFDSGIWSHLDVSQMMFATLYSTHRNSYRSEFISLLQLVAVYQCVSYCSSIGSKFAGKPNTSVSISYVLFEWPNEMMLACWRQCFHGVVTRLCCHMALSMLSAMLPSDVDSGLCSAVSQLLRLEDVVVHLVDWRTQLTSVSAANALEVGSGDSGARGDQLLHNYDALRGQIKSVTVARLHTRMGSHCTTTCQLLRNLASAHRWLHHTVLRRVLLDDAPIYSSLQPNKSGFLEKIRIAVESMEALQASLSSVHSKLVSVRVAVGQRLKWAAGTNPEIFKLCSHFEHLLDDQEPIFQTYSRVRQELAQFCVAIAHFEKLCDNSPETQSAVSAVNSVIDGLKCSLEMKQACLITVSVPEQALIQRKPATEEDGVNADWLTTTLGDLKDAEAKTTRELAEKEQDVARKSSELLSHAYATRNVLSTHHKTMLELRSVIKTLARQEETTRHVANANTNSFSSYIRMYKLFSDKVASSVKSVGSLSSVANLQALLDDFSDIRGKMDSVYDGLLRLGAEDSKWETAEPGFTVFKAFDVETKHQQQLTVNIVGSGNLNEDKKSKHNIATVADNMEEETNAQAMAIWRRVKQKLEGFDLDIELQSSVETQVDHIIEQATSLDNLALMYEGWTAWV